MRLKWQDKAAFGSRSILPQWVADGEHYSYQITHLLVSGEYQVLKMRQPCGQIVASTFAMTLDGAEARAQVWEDS